MNADELDWSLLRTFLAVAEHGSLSKAAQETQASQPTLTRQLAALEAEAGAALFERSGRGMVPTAAGRALLEPARRVREAVAGAVKALAARAGDEGGTVRISASELVAAHVLPAILARLRHAHPEIQIELVPTNRVDNLLEREADIAVRMAEPAQGSLITRRVGHCALGFYAHRSYVERFGLPQPDGQQMHHWIGLDKSMMLVNGFRQGGIAVDREFFGFRCDSQLVGWEAVRAGLGIGMGLRQVGDACNELVRVLPQVQLPQLPMWLTAHRELKDSAPLRRTFDHLAEALTGPA